MELDAWIRNVKMTDSEVDSDKVYVCSYAGCKFRFRQKNRLRNHLNAHQGIVSLRIIC